MKIFLVLALALLPNCACAKEKVLLGIDVLQKDGFALLKGKKIGLITNHTGVNSKGESTIDLLYNAPGVKLVSIFAPEHGLRGIEEHGKEITDGKDAKTGLPVYSLYGKTKRPTDEMLKGLDALVFDIQDIGTRFYTYTTTLAYALEEAARHNLEFVVLDRPNPITGAVVEGEPLAPGIDHFTAYLHIPTRHGMTAGEIAGWHNATARLNAKLIVVKMQGWRRDMWWDDTGLAFHPTSPNIQTLNAALLYPAIGAFEATNVSVGRGTKMPFEIFGAPWINADELADKMDFFLLRGLEISPVVFVPADDLYKGEKCGGIKIKIADKNTARPIDLFVYAAVALRELYPDQFVLRWDEVARVTGSDTFKKLLLQNQSAEAILEIFHNKAAKFQEESGEYLLY